MCSPSILSQRAQAALRALSASHVDAAVAAPSSVLRVVVENLVYPVSLDALYQVTPTTHHQHHKHQQVGGLKFQTSGRDFECSLVSLCPYRMRSGIVLSVGLQCCGSSQSPTLTGVTHVQCEFDVSRASVGRLVSVSITSHNVLCPAQVFLHLIGQ